jgi:hypothetical protein
MLKDVAVAVGGLVPDALKPSEADPGIINELFPKGAKAMGGSITAGNWLVGERGPEIVSVGGSGYVTPNDMIGGSQVNITVNGNIDRPVLADMTYALRRVQMEVVT